jgi:hypothetical protein
MNRSCATIAALATVLMALATRSTLADEARFLGRTRLEWVSTLEASGRRERTHAAWAISQFAVEQVKPTDAMLWLNELCLLTESDSPSVRYWGVVGIGQYLRKVEAEHPTHETALVALSAALKDRAVSPRLAAAEALALSGRTNQTLPILVAGMSDPQEAVRIQAVTALANLGSAAAPARDTLQAAASDQSEYVKRIANRALSRLDGK